MKRLILVVMFALLANSLFPKEWWKNAVFYEIFIRSFYDSDEDGKGDVKGMIEKLDYLNDGNPKTMSDLGIDAVWLMPAFESPSYHGYDTVDYYKIDKEYGTEADFDLFIKEAHKRGIKIILDLVINHTSANNPWFVKSAMKEDPYTDYYVWSQTIPEGPWGKPWGGGGANTVWSFSNVRKEYYYSIFWSGMPDLNYKNKAVTQEIYKIAEYWIKKGIDGFRLDAARYLIEEGGGPGQSDSPATLKWWRDFNAFCKKINPNTMLVGETWEANTIVSKYYDGGKGLDLCFDFALSSGILAFVNGKNSVKVTEIFAQKKTLPAPNGFYAPFLSNHDQFRAMNMLGNDFNKAKLAAVVLLTMPGTPFLYYGEEVGLFQNSGKQDELKRTPMPWTSGANAGFTSGNPWAPPAPYADPYNVSAQQKDPDSLWNLYRMLLAVRKAYPELAGEDVEFIDTGDKAVLGYTRGKGKNKVFVFVNASDTDKNISIPELNGKLIGFLMTGGQEQYAKDAKVYVKGYSFQIMKIKK
ncbi:MAG: hypothetical protein A2Y33_15185 [Spirochaetes bacterium GWF1_51_8]|nr:MAG: hypothetical protein A2Y33_15185 [Spirochaetes bacterium GWF1_51_8]